MDLSTVSEITIPEGNVESISIGGIEVWSSGYEATVEGIPPLTLLGSKGKALKDYKIYGQSRQNGTPTPETPIEVESCGDKTVNLFDISQVGTPTFGGSASYGTLIDGVFTCKIGAYAGIPKVKYTSPILQAGTYTISYDVRGSGIGVEERKARSIYIYNATTGTRIANKRYTDVEDYYQRVSFTFTLTEDVAIKFCIGGEGNAKNYRNLDFQFKNIQIEQGSTATEYEPYNKYKIPILSFDNQYWGKVDLGTLTYNRTSLGRYTVTDIASLNMSYNRADWTTPTDIYVTNKSNKNIVLKGAGIYENPTPFIVAGTITVGVLTQNYHSRLCLVTNEYNSANDLKQALSGTYLYYPLATAPTPLVQPTTTNIYLNEPLRKIGNVSDYIDFKNGKVVRNNDEIASYNGETITTSYISSTGSLDVGSQVVYQLLQPTEESITLPNIPTFKGTNIIGAMTTTQPSNMSAKYDRKR